MAKVTWFEHLSDEDDNIKNPQAVAQVFIEVWVDCPHCGTGQDIREQANDKNVWDKDDGLRATGCKMEVTCWACKEQFIVTEIRH